MIWFLTWSMFVNATADPAKTSWGHGRVQFASQVECEVARDRFLARLGPTGPEFPKAYLTDANCWSEAAWKESFDRR